MIEFGNSLRAAREAKGYTIGQIAETTHMAPTTIRELENEDFTRIAAPIYGRGFVKLYCEAVGLDPKPFVAEFMEIYNGNRETAIRERSVAHESEPPAAPPPAPEPIDEPPPAPEPIAAPPPAPELIAAPPPVPEPIAAPPPAPEPIDEPPPVARSSFTSVPRSDVQPDLFHPAPEPPPAPAPFAEKEPSAEPPSLSRYAAPIRQMRPPAIPRSVWRVAILATAAIAFLWILGLGFRALYRATSSAPAPTTDVALSAPPAADTPPEERPAAVAPKAETAAPEVKPAAPAAAKTKTAPAAPNKARVPQKIPALYVD